MYPYEHSLLQIIWTMKIQDLERLGKWRNSSDERRNVFTFIKFVTKIYSSL